MAGKFKVLFADFLRSLRQLWLELIGAIFLIFGIVFTITAIQEYRKYLSNPGYGTGSLVVAGIFSAVMFLFALESFWKARKTR